MQQPSEILLKVVSENKISKFSEADKVNLSNYIVPTSAY
jgi:hypothetical protein